MRRQQRGARQLWAEGQARGHGCESGVGQLAGGGAGVTALALLLLLASAVAHAAWNLLAKRASDSRPFMWLMNLVEVLAYAPAVGLLAWKQRPDVSAVGLLFAAGSAALHGLYYLQLQRAYRLADYSLVYPLARGSAPLLTVTVAVTALGERPSPLALAGLALIVGGVFVLTGGGRRPLDRTALGQGLLTGLLIAAYTLWDQRAVRALAMPPWLYEWLAAVVRVGLLLPTALAGPGSLARCWRAYRAEVVGVGLLSPLAYVLVLTAMTFTPLSYVAPAREVSLLVGVLLAGRFLQEGETARRLAATSAIVLGLAALALARPAAG